MTILAYLALWKRPQITRICFDGLVRLRAFAKVNGIAMDVLCVGSEKSMEKLCKEYGFHYTYHRNQPLGEKKNHGLNEAIKLQWDYLLELGSDDLIKSEALLHYLPLMQEGIPYMCLGSIAFIDSQSGECRTYESNTVFGAGRLMHRDMLNHLLCLKVRAKTALISTEQNMEEGKSYWVPKSSAESMQAADQCEIIDGPAYKLWLDEQERRLDGHSDYVLHTKGYNCHRIDSPVPLAIDIKSNQNLWSFTPEIGHPAYLKDLMEGLSDREINAIKKLIVTNKRLQSQLVTA